MSRDSATAPKWLARFNGLFPWWVPPSVTAAVLAFVNWVLGLSGPTILGYATAGLIAVGFFFLMPNLKVRYALFALFVPVAAFAVLRAYQDAQKYDLNEIGLKLYPSNLPTKAGEPVTLTKMEVTAAFGNENDFPVTMKAIRAYASLARQVSGNTGGDGVEVIPAHSPRPAEVGDGEIAFLEPIKITGPIWGTVDYSICFGRGKDAKKFDKQFRLKGAFAVVANSDGTLSIKEMDPADPGDENNGWYPGCHR